MALSVCARAGAAQAQCETALDSADTAVHLLYRQHAWADLVRRVESLPARSPEVDFEYGMALAHLARWSEAKTALMEGRRACPRSKRFPIELAGVAFQQKDYAEAAAWLRRGLKLDPRDRYALDFAATDEYLLGNLNAALKYWAAIGKPYIAAIHVDPQPRVERLLLERAFAFAPAQTMTLGDLQTTQARLDQLGVFSAWRIALQARPDGTFDAEFHAVERDGFGDGKAQALLATFSGLPYETIYPAYFNLRHEAMNVESLLRWDAEKQRAWVRLAAPLDDLPQWRWQASTDERAENWVVRRSFSGAAPPLGSLRLERAVVAGSLAEWIDGRFRWSMGAELSHRAFTHVDYGPALNSSLLAAGWQAKQLANVETRLLDIPARRLQIAAGAGSELARLWSSPARAWQKLQSDARMVWFPQASGNKYEWDERVRAGKAFGAVPFDELWMLGMERDSDLWLRGDIGARDGRKGSSPLATGYFLANSDVRRTLYDNGLFAVTAGPLLDVARAGAPNAGLAPRQWLVSTGAEARLSVLGTSLVLTCGRDVRMGTNAFYATVARLTF